MLLRRCMMIDRHLLQVLALGLGLPVLLGACATSPPRPEGQVEVLTTAKGAPLAGADCTVETGGGSWKLTTPATVNVGEPRGDLRVVPDAGVVRADAPLRHDRGRLGDDQPGAAACERAEVHEVPVGRHAVDQLVHQHRPDGQHDHVKWFGRGGYVFTSPKGSRGGFGALHLGEYVDGALTYTGRVGSGFSEKQLGEVGTVLPGDSGDKCFFH